MLVAIPIAAARGLRGTNVVAGLGSLRVISDAIKPSPFTASPSCPNPRQGKADHNYTDAEVEPRVAADPRGEGRRTTLIAAWQQDRWAVDGSRGLVVAYSHDNGLSWSVTPLPFTVCSGAIVTGAKYERASDPWVSIGPDGIAYAAGLVFTPDPTVPSRTEDNAIEVATSPDGGATWSRPTRRPVRVAESKTEEFDKEAVTADPRKRGVAYLVWDVVGEKITYFSKTTDAGRTWSHPAKLPIADPTIGNEVLVDPRDGTLYDLYDVPATAQIELIRSSDGGATWSAPMLVSRLNEGVVSDPSHAPNGERLRTGDILSDGLVDPHSGALYVTWEAKPTPGAPFNEIEFASSTDRGASWSAARTINTRTDGPAFIPTIAETRASVLGITYYDLRELIHQSPPLSTDYWLALSFDKGASWQHEIHLAGDFNMLRTPKTLEDPEDDALSKGFFVGDYQGLVTTEDSFHAVFVTSNAGGRGGDLTDVYERQLDPTYPRVDVNPSHGPPGSAVTITGEGFRPGLSAAVTFDCPYPQCRNRPLLGTTTVDNAGRFTLNATIPIGALPTVHYIGADETTSATVVPGSLEPYAQTTFTIP